MHQQSMIPADNTWLDPFPAPRGWGFGWEGDARAGRPHQHSTLDIWPDVPGRTILIINDIAPPPATQTDSC